LNGEGASDRAAVTIALGGLIALAAAIGIGRFVYTPILPSMVAALGLSKSEAGLIASANFLGYLIGALAASFALPRGRERLAMLAALALSAVTTTAMAAPNSLAVILVLRFIGGVASAFVLVLATGLVLDRLTRVGRADLSDWHFGGVGAGIAASAVLVSVLSAAGGDWRLFWFGAGVLAAVGLGLVAWLLPDGSPSAAPRSESQPPSDALASERRCFVLAYGLFGFGYVITATFLVAIVRGDPAMRTIEPAIWVIVGLTAVPSVAVWGLIGRRIGIGKAFAIACIVEAVGILGCLWPGGIGGAIVAALVLGATMMGITALGLMGARELDPARPQRSVALMTAAFGLGQILGPFVAGLTIDRTGGYGAAMAIAATALLLAAAVVPRAGMAAPRAGTAGARATSGNPE
jgi:predicted MFS family arabinose efflux permease